MVGEALPPSGHETCDRRGLAERLDAVIAGDARHGDAAESRLEVRARPSGDDDDAVRLRQPRDQPPCRRAERGPGGLFRERGERAVEIKRKQGSAGEQGGQLARASRPEQIAHP